MNKKVGSVFLMTLLMSVISISLISAQVEFGSNSATSFGDSIVNLVDGFAKTLNPIAKYIVGDVTSVGKFGSGEILFAKVLFLIIILSIVWLVFSKIEFFNETEWIHWTLSIIVSILAVRFLGPELLQSMILPYSTLGVAIAAGLPFVLYFFIVEFSIDPARKTLRRIAWIFFAVIFIGLWMARSADLGSGSKIYLWTAIASLVIMTFDGTIQRFRIGLQIEKAGVANKQELDTALRRKMAQADTDATAGIITVAEATKRKKKYMKQIAYLNK